MRQFLTPGWVLTAVVAVAFSYVAFTVLAPWQLGKNSATQHRNEQLERAFELEPVDVADIMPPQRPFAEGQEWRRVHAQGSFIPDTTVLLRNRPVNGAPAIQVLDVFAADNGENYLVNRGFVRPSTTDIPKLEPAPSGTVTISALVRRNEVAAHTPPITSTPPQVYGITTTEIAQLTGVELHPDWLQLADGSPAAIEAIPLPTLESGPYLSYGIQWIFFGAMAPLAVLWFIRAELVERRRERAEQAEMAESAQAKPAESAEIEAADVEPTTTGLAEPAEPDEVAAAQTEPNEVAAAQTQRTESAELHRQRLAQRYGDSGHRPGARDDRYQERF